MSVSKETKETIVETVDQVFRKMSGIPWIERQKQMQEDAFKNTEKVLYCYRALKEHVANEQEYLDIAFHGKSKSITSYCKNGSTPKDEDLILRDRQASYERSKNDIERIEKALDKIKDRKGYDAIEIRYLQRKETKEGKRVNEQVYTWEEITDILANTDGYPDNLNEKTVRNYKNTLIREMAVLLFGSDAI